MTVPAGSTVARFATYDADYPAGTDIDLFVYQAGTTTLVGQSAGGTAEESVTLTAAGTYDVYANLFAAPVASTEVVAEHVRRGLDRRPGTSPRRRPAQAVTTGTNATVNLAWSNLAAGTRYLGVLLVHRREQQPDRQDAGLAELTEFAGRGGTRVHRWARHETR